jgi:hypothetical protein
VGGGGGGSGVFLKNLGHSLSRAGASLKACAPLFHACRQPVEAYSDAGKRSVACCPALNGSRVWLSAPVAHLVQRLPHVALHSVLLAQLAADAPHEGGARDARCGQRWGAVLLARGKERCSEACTAACLEALLSCRRRLADDQQASRLLLAVQASAPEPSAHPPHATPSQSCPPARCSQRSGTTPACCGRC